MNKSIDLVITYESHLQAHDHRTRSQWLKSLNVAIGNCDQEQRYQRQQLDKRRLNRQEEKEKDEEELLRNSDLGEQLENEKQARVNAEEKAETLARQRVIEGEKMKELEKIREQLESLLDEERQVKFCHFCQFL